MIKGIAFNKWSEFNKNFLIIVIFLILPYLFFNDAIFLGKYLHGSGDALSYNLPWRFFVLNNFKNLSLSLWNPLNFNGYPFISNIQAGIFYFPNIILGLIFTTLISYNLSLFLHYSLCGIFTYLLVKEYGLSRIASFSSGLIFMFSGFMVIRQSHAPMIFTAAWLPLILFLFEKYIRIKNKKYIFIGALILALQFFAGNHQIFLYCSIIIFLYILFSYFLKAKVKELKKKL